MLTINEFIVDRVRARLAPTEVLLCCSHTHSGPIAYADGKSPRRDREYINSLVDNIAAAVQEAGSDLDAGAAGILARRGGCGHQPPRAKAGRAHGDRAQSRRGTG